MSILSLRPDGTLETLGGDDFPLSALGPATVERVSRLYPVNPAKRLIFKALRFTFGEKGRIADFTRSFKGPWEATILRTGERFIGKNRAVCLQWEAATLAPNY
jgi:hypothetical protein